MRLGIDVRLWRETGVGRYIRNLVENLYDVDDQNDYILFALKKDVDYLRANFFKWKTVEANIRWHSIDEQRLLPGIIEKESLDLVHFPYFSVPIKYQRPFIVTMHDLIIYSSYTGQASTLPFPFFIAKKFAYKYVISKALKNSTAVIVPSNSVKDEVLKLNKVDQKKIHVIKEGVTLLKGSNTEVLSELGIESKKYFLYVGNAYPHKNLECLINSFLRLSSQNPSVKLVLAGKKDFFYSRLEESPVAKALSSSLVFAKDVSDEELSILYKKCIAFISPSLSEGFALPALEAMGSGAPIILSDIPTFREICRDIPLVYFDPHDELSVRNAMEKVLELSSIEIRNHIQLGKILAKSYSWRKMAQQTLEIYESSTSLRSSEQMGGSGESPFGSP